MYGIDTVNCLVKTWQITIKVGVISLWRGDAKKAPCSGMLQKCVQSTEFDKQCQKFATPSNICSEDQFISSSSWTFSPLRGRFLSVGSTLPGMDTKMHIVLQTGVHTLRCDSSSKKKSTAILSSQHLQ